MGKLSTLEVKFSDIDLNDRVHSEAMQITTRKIGAYRTNGC